MKEGSGTMNFDEIYTRKNEEEYRDFLDKSNEKEIEDLYVLSPLKIRWHYVIFQTYNHIAGAYGLYLTFTEAKWQTILFVAILDVLSVLGITAGSHRLWSHRSYKATLPLRIFLAILATLPMQHSISRWVLDHRVHHKYSETNADPHNARRGFLYSHILWLFTYETDDTLKKYSTIDMSDIKADPVTKFQWKYYYILTGVITYFLPTVIPIWLWGETYQSAYFIAVHLRLVFTYHQVFLVNSVAHRYGFRPYDANIHPVENILCTILFIGEGFHNYHHTFPWDYAASEFGIKYNLTTALIDTMAWLGLISDRKTAPKSLIESRKRRTGEDYLHQMKGFPNDSSEKLAE